MKYIIPFRERNIPELLWMLFTSPCRDEKYLLNMDDFIFLFSGGTQSGDFALVKKMILSAVEDFEGSPTFSKLELPDEYPQTVNKMFLHALRLARQENESFLWLETDCFINKIHDFEKEMYEKTLFMSSIIYLPNQGVFPHGVSVYPKNFEYDFEKKVGKNINSYPIDIPFDICALRDAIRFIQPTNSIKQIDGPYVSVQPKDMKHAIIHGLKHQHLWKMFYAVRDLELIDQFGEFIQINDVPGNENWKSDWRQKSQYIHHRLARANDYINKKIASICASYGLDYCSRDLLTDQQWQDWKKSYLSCL